MSSIPNETPEQQARVDRMKRMQPGHIAPLAVYLASDRSIDVTGQVFTVRANEIFLMSQPRPLAVQHAPAGWTAESIASDAMPAFRASLYPLEKSADVFTGEPR